jgi:hypothetical protein
VVSKFEHENFLASNAAASQLFPKSPFIDQRIGQIAGANGPGPFSQYVFFCEIE